MACEDGVVRNRDIKRENLGINTAADALNDSNLHFDVLQNTAAWSCDILPTLHPADGIHRPRTYQLFLHDA